MVHMYKEHQELLFTMMNTTTTAASKTNSIRQILQWNKIASMEIIALAWIRGKVHQSNRQIENYTKINIQWKLKPSFIKVPLYLEEQNQPISIICSNNIISIQFGWLIDFHSYIIILVPVGHAFCSMVYKTKEMKKSLVLRRHR